MSKSVRLNTTDATTGTTKKTAISASAGATNAHPGATRGPSAAIAMLRAREHPAALLEDRVDVGVERGERRIERRPAADRRLDVLAERARDALPFRDLRCRAHVPKLDPERLRAAVVAQQRVVPRVAARREITGESIERELLRGLGQILDEAPRRVGVRRAARAGE